MVFEALATDIGPLDEASSLSVVHFYCDEKAFTDPTMHAIKCLDEFLSIIEDELRDLKKLLKV